MPQYLSPGVYVEEVPSAVQPIAGVGTSTAGFIGIFPDSIVIPVESVTDEYVGKGDGTKTSFQLKKYPVWTEAGKYEVRVQGVIVAASLENDDDTGKSNVNFAAGNLPPADKVITVSYVNTVNLSATSQKIVVNEKVGKGDDKQTKRFKLSQWPVETTDLSRSSFKVNSNEIDKADFELDNDDARSTSYVIFLKNAPGDGEEIIGTYEVITPPKLAPAGIVKICTSFADFTKYFGGFSIYSGQRNLAHAVYGFFNNGGTRCYVVRVTADTDVSAALEKFAAIDEIAIVAAPGLTDASLRSEIVTHCEQMTQDRFAILDSAEVVETTGNLDLTQLDPSNTANILPDNSDYAAIYFPWIQVFDPATKIQDPSGNGLVYVPPSGHIAGIYARVDTNRGVHKAPANEPVLGALGLKYNISKAQQDGLNPQGVNCIRDLNGNIRVWGARTIGGDRNGEWKYINVRRLFLFLRESIDEGTQWVVFEPNDQALWAKITRNVTAFLTNVWRAGALFGSTPQEAFYVRCDATTNPPEVRDLGQVVTEIGVAVVKPAEFVIFRITQWAGPGK